MPPKSSMYSSQPSFDDALKQMVNQMNNKRRSRSSRDFGGGDDVFEDAEDDDTVQEIEKKFWRDSIASHEPSWRSVGWFGLDWEG